MHALISSHTVQTIRRSCSAAIVQPEPFHLENRPKIHDQNRTSHVGLLPFRHVHPSRVGCLPCFWCPFALLGTALDLRHGTFYDPRSILRSVSCTLRFRPLSNPSKAHVRLARCERTKMFLTISPIQFRTRPMHLYHRKSLFRNE